MSPRYPTLRSPALASRERPPVPRLALREARWLQGEPIVRRTRGGRVEPPQEVPPSVFERRPASLPEEETSRVLPSPNRQPIPPLPRCPRRSHFHLQEAIRSLWGSIFRKAISGLAHGLALGLGRARNPVPSMRYAVARCPAAGYPGPRTPRRLRGRIPSTPKPPEASPHRSRACRAGALPLRPPCLPPCAGRPTHALATQEAVP